MVHHPHEPEICLDDTSYMLHLKGADQMSRGKDHSRRLIERYKVDAGCQRRGAMEEDTMTNSGKAQIGRGAICAERNSVPSIDEGTLRRISSAAVAKGLAESVVTQKH